MSGPGERRRVVDLYSATPMAAARVAERLGYPTGQCLECRPAKDPGYAGHMAKSIIPLETGTKAIEPVPGSMRPKGAARAWARATTGSRRIAGAVWPRCGPKTGTPANPKHRLD